MNFRVDRWSAVALRSSLVVLMAVGALLLSSCGGSGQSSQSKRFHPTRMIVFGDETSLLLPPSTPHGVDALKYTNNGFDALTSTTLDCSSNPIWVQQLAAEYGLVFDECNPTAATPTAQMRATVGGKVADVVTAVDAFLATSAPVPTDLITMMVGTNDILELYNSVNSSALTEAAAVIEIERRGALVATQIGRLTSRDNKKGRLIYATVPDPGLTPFGRSQSSDGRTLLALLTKKFNDAMRNGVEINGHSLGFLDAGQKVRNIVDTVLKGKSADAITNVTAVACSTAVPNCTPSTLVSGATAINYLWAGDLYLGYAGHLYVGDDARNLATGLPW